MVAEGSFTETDRLEGQSALLDKVAQAACSCLERDELLRAIFGAISSFVYCHSLGFFWKEPTGKLRLTAVVQTSNGISLEQDAVDAGTDSTEGPPQPIYSPDNLRASHPVLRRLGSHGMGASVCAPVVVADQVLGYLALNRREPFSFSSRELLLIGRIAVIVGPALNSVRLYERLDNALKDLSLAKDELARSERMVVQGELASGVAHDINNILGLIAARADILRMQGLSREAMESAEAIQKAVDDGITVVRRMSQFTRKQRNQELISLDVNRLVEDALEMTRPRWQAPQISSVPRVKVRFESGPPLPVMGVPPELREVMVNLIMNAVDAMPSGGEIGIATRQEGIWAIISVSDTGCGIPEDVRQHIFDPFFTTKGEGGSGLGLWVSNGIVARHGGGIQVHTHVGQGSCFTVKLPLLKSEVARPQPKSLGGRKSILVVDDEAGLAETLRLALEIEGYLVQVSVDPVQALEVFRENPFDLVITDLRMPGMNGWELAAEIKCSCPQTPIIAMTGWPVDLIKDGQRSSNMEAIIQKPYRVNDLKARIATLFADAGKSV